MTKAQNIYKDLTELQTAVDTLPGSRKEAADKLLKEIVFLEQTMGKLKTSIDVAGAVIKTARTTRENPALKAYNTSIQRYSLLFKQVVDMLPEPPKAAPVDPLLDFVKGGV
jgi:phage-related tail protein